MNSTKDFTQDKLKKMEASGADIPYAQDSDKDTEADNWGMKAASTSNEGKFKEGGAVKPHMGRARRASGGKVMKQVGRGPLRSNEAEEHIDYKKEVPKPTAVELGDYPKIRARGGKVDDEREHRAHGGRTKGKTVVNVIVGGQDKPPQPMPIPVPQPAPQAPPPPPPHPPMPPMGGAPGGMPPGPGGPPPGMPPGMPPGQMPMRARGGKVMGGAGGGLGRIQKANEEGAHIPVPKN